MWTALILSFSLRPCRWSSCLLFLRPTSSSLWVLLWQREYFMYPVWASVFLSHMGSRLSHIKGECPKLCYCLIKGKATKSNLSIKIKTNCSHTCSSGKHEQNTFFTRQLLLQCWNEVQTLLHMNKVIAIDIKTHIAPLYYSQKYRVLWNVKCQQFEVWFIISPNQYNLKLL